MAILVTCEACKQTFRVRDEYLDKKAWCPACRAPITLTGERLPNHEVFISYSNKDKQVADAICAKLEALPLRCWIAPRDVAAGHSWGSSIIEAIEEAKVMVLVYSGNSNLSPQVIREVERAVSKGLVLVPFRIEATMMSKDMEYFLSSSHWIDALTPPLEKHLVELGELVRTVLFRKEKEAAAAQKPAPTKLAKPVPATPTSPASQSKSRNKLWIAMAVVLVAMLGMAGWWFGSNHQPMNQKAAATTSSVATKQQSRVTPTPKPVETPIAAAAPAANMEGAAITISCSDAVRVLPLVAGNPKYYDSPSRRDIIESVSPELSGWQYVSPPLSVGGCYYVRVNQSGFLYVFGCHNLKPDRDGCEKLSKWEKATGAIQAAGLSNNGFSYRRKVAAGEIIKLNDFHLLLAARSIELVQDGKVEPVLPPTATAPLPANEPLVRTIPPEVRDLLTPEFKALSAEDQVKRVTAKLQELNPGYDGGFAYKKDKKSVVVDVSIKGKAITNLWPLRAFVNLAKFHYNSGPLEDLSPLVGLPLERIDCTFCPVSDLSPLRSMMKLSFINLCGSQVQDVSPLRSLPLNHLYIHKTLVADLAPLAGSSLTLLNCVDAKVVDLSPLSGIKNLHSLICDFKADRDSKILRSIKTLETINKLSAGEFWKRVDAGQSPQARNDVAGDDAEYIVAAGDTMAKIAHAQGITLQALLVANPGVVIRDLKRGQMLVIPSSNTSSSPAPQSNQTIQPWTNSLGMKFVPVPGTAVLFSIWDTRVQDYQAFVTATGRAWRKPDFEQGPAHPAVNVLWDAAKAFCAWLTEKERSAGTLTSAQEYRLPTDLEWSTAVGLDSETGGTPEERGENGKNSSVYPWGKQWPPPWGAGNYRRQLSVDNFDFTSPVGSFAANQFGLYDMGGNVWQWCKDNFNPKSGHHVLRGGAYNYGLPEQLLSSFRRHDSGGDILNIYGFRCVLAKVGTGAANPAMSSDK